jgi:hypothetical protein
MSYFSRFLDKKQRDHKKRLLLIGKILKKSGFKVVFNLDDSDPYVYVRKPKSKDIYIQDLSFDGVRVYLKNDNYLCIRPQMKSNTLPFGDSYLLDIADMYRDLSDSGDKEAGEKVVKNLAYVIKDFFKQSGKAEADDPPAFIDTKMGGVVGNTMGTDYANTVQSLSKGS